MTGTKRFLTRMVLFLVVVAAVIALLFSGMQNAFMANPALNGLIVAVLLLGIVYSFRQVMQLGPEVEWIEAFKGSELGAPPQGQPVLLAPMATMLRERQGRVSLSALSLRSILDSISARLDEGRDISRYLIGLLIFLGLLGTFWGLLETISSVGKTISGLDIGGGDFAAVFAGLKSGLEEPLKGMGTAFSSSLFGLAGSLVLGFLDLQANQSQNRFYIDLEDWLSSVTRLSSGSGIAEGDQSVPAYVQALLEQTADSLENLQRTMARSEDNRGSSNATMMQLTERLTMLTDQMKSEQDLLVKLVEVQMEMKPVLQRLASERDAGGLDQASRNHLRNLDVYVMRLLEETAEGRDQMTQEIRSEIKLLARTIAAIAEEERQI